MTVRQLRDYLNTLPESDMDCECVLPMESPIHGMFAFQGVCPGVTEMIELGPVPEYIKDLEGLPQQENQRVLLIAGHSFHDEEESDEDIHKKILN